MSALWDATRDLHHACEFHPVGESMAAGNPPQQWYADWLKNLYLIHLVLDKELPNVVHRSERLSNDVAAMLVVGKEHPSILEYVEKLKDDSVMREGASYVLTGAHLMGGEVMRRKLVGYPTTHLEWDDRQEALKVLKVMREKGNLEFAAKDCFSALLTLMDEIKG